VVSNSLPTESSGIARHDDLPLADVVRRARKQAGLSQAELALLLGVRQSSVSQWERGSTHPSNRHLLQLIILWQPWFLEMLTKAIEEHAADHPTPAAEHDQPTPGQDPQ